MYMDNRKIFAENEKELKSLLQTIRYGYFKRQTGEIAYEKTWTRQTSTEKLKKKPVK